MTNKELIQNFERLVQEERRVTREVLEHIAEIESRKAYLEMGFEGMYSYLTQGLGYSEGSAYRRLQAARVLKVKPFVAGKIESGSLNLMQLTEVAKLSRQTKQEISNELLAKIESQSKSVTEQILAAEFNLPKQIETRTRTHQDHSVRLEVTLSREQYASLRKAKDLLSHICPDGDIASVITELANQCIKRAEGKKSSPQVAKLCVKEAPPTNQFKLNSNGGSQKLGNSSSEGIRRKYISIHMKRELFARSQGQCEYLDTPTGRRCTSGYQPQIDHIVPVSRGGLNHPENLQLLCAAHNRAKAAN